MLAPPVYHVTLDIEPRPYGCPAIKKIMYMKNQHDTEDMVQNTFIRLMGDGTVFQSEEHKKAWLIRTATNLCKDHFRHWWSKTVGIDKAAEKAADQPFYTDGNYELVMALPLKYKTAIYLYYYEGYSTVEIAEMLGKKQSTIRSYMHTGRKLSRGLAANCVLL